jgi:recombination protein RecR
VRLPEGFQDVSRALAALPGVGERTSSRFAFYLLDHPAAAEAIADTAARLSDRVTTCPSCFGLADAGPADPICPICRDPSRDRDVICVVETVPHQIAIEGSGIFRGRYHILHGALSPIRGIGPDQLHLPQLVERVASTVIEEVIVATDVDVEGEATAAYIQEILRSYEVNVTRIATGVPMGSDLEYLDPNTLARALQGRKPQADLSL